MSRTEGTLDWMCMFAAEKCERSAFCHRLLMSKLSLTSPKNKTEAWLITRNHQWRVRPQTKIPRCAVGLPFTAISTGTEPTKPVTTGLSHFINKINNSHSPISVQFVCICWYLSVCCSSYITLLPSFFCRLEIKVDSRGTRPSPCTKEPDRFTNVKKINK